MKENILNPNKTDSENNEVSTRPVSFDDFIGQESLKENLKVFIKSAKLREDSLDHILFYGPPGLGKTTLSQIIANELGAQIKITSGPAITRSGDLAAILTNVSEGDVIFIDEIHRLSTSVEEILYSAMEDFKIDIMIGEGVGARSVRIDLPKFTLVGATTRYGMLSNPLRDRFGIPLQLDFYNTEDLKQIVTRSAKIIGVGITEDGSIELAKRSRGTPRIVNRLLKRVRDYALSFEKNIIDKEIADYALNKLKVDKVGLDSQDLKYLTYVAKYYQGGPVGVDTIAATLSEQKDTVEDAIEPYLLKEGFIARTPRGRKLTTKAWNHIGLKEPNNEDEYKLI